MKEKQAAVIADFSGFGRCSLTVALPILSVMGVQTSCIPTAVLSTHTGGFHGYTFRDLTQDMRPFAAHWKKEGLSFDAVYTGYLGNREQISLVEEIFDLLCPPLRLVDPAMADDGKMYSLCDARLAQDMKRLCAKADVIVPNMTEACLLTGIPYHTGAWSKAEINALCDGLLSLGAKNALLTGVTLTGDEDMLGAVCAGSSALTFCMAHRAPGRYDGTGDVFASVLLGGLMGNLSLPRSAQLAVDFTARCVENSLRENVNPHHGVDFEKELWTLGREMAVLRK